MMLPMAAAPAAGLLQATNGNFYGLTSGGGTSYYGTFYPVLYDGQDAVRSYERQWNRDQHGWLHKLPRHLHATFIPITRTSR